MTLLGRFRVNLPKKWNKHRFAHHSASIREKERRCLTGMTMGLTMVLPIVLGAVSAWYLNEGYEWARVVIIIEGALRMILDIVYVGLCAHVLFDNGYNSQMLRVLFFGPFMTLEVLCAKLAFDFISRILIIVLLCQPQVGRYIHMRGDLRRMGLK